MPFRIALSGLTAASTDLKVTGLLMSPLKGADGKIYALAQGSVIVGGFGVSSGDGSSMCVFHL